MSSSTPAVVARLLLPRLPLMLKTTLMHALSLSPTSSKWDLRTALIVNVIRSIMAGSTSSITQQQRFSTRDPGVKGPMWVAPITLPTLADGDDICDVLFNVIDELKTTGQESIARCEAIPVEAEWTGYRSNVAKDAPPPEGISVQEKYSRLMSETTSKTTILYFHGGALYLMDPASHRPVVTELSKYTGGRALNVRYRLAPQHPFPAALLDCLMAYLSLLYPPEGSLHEAVAPEHIVFSGDSAGGNLSLALVLLILQFHRSATAQGRSNPTVKFHGKDVQLPLPGGLALNSAWCDCTRAMPSISSNAVFDYLPPVKPSIDYVHDPSLEDPVNKHACEAWPCNPPRADLYCDGSALCHPLISPLAATKEMLKGAPPMYFIVGEEMLADEVRIMARRCVEAGVQVRVEGYEAMPHVFAPMFEGTPRSKRCYEGWGKWIKAITNPDQADKKVPVTGGVWIKARSGSELNLDLNTELTEISDDECFRLMNQERDRRNKVFEEYIKRVVQKRGLATATMAKL